MAIQFLIGGVDYTNYVDLKSVKIASNITVSQDTCTFDINIPKRSIARPMGGQEIKIKNGSVVEFGGVILSPHEIALATDQMLYQIQCKDYTYWLDKKLVVNTYDNYTAGNIVKDIISKFASGFTSNNVQGAGSSFFMSQIKFDHVAPSKAIGTLADDTGFQWWVDYYKDVHFSPVMTNPSPLPGNYLYPDTDTKSYSDLEFDEDVSQVRNQIYLQGFKIPAIYTVTQTFTTDGQTTTYYTTYEPNHYLTKIVVKLNGSVVSCDLDIAGGLPNSQLANGKCYIYYKNMSYRWNVALAAGQTLTITYYPMLEMINMYNDPVAMAEMKKRDLQDGVYEYAIRDQQLTSVDQTLAKTRGQLELYKYAYPHYSGDFNSFLQGWQAGQYFYLTSSKRMDGIFQAQVFYIIKVEKEIASHPNGGIPTFKYKITFSDTPYSY